MAMNEIRLQLISELFSECFVYILQSALTSVAAKFALS